jgi:hypothetical protein
VATTGTPIPKEAVDALDQIGVRISKLTDSGQDALGRALLRFREGVVACSVELAAGGHGGRGDALREGESLLGGMGFPRYYAFTGALAAWRLLHSRAAPAPYAPPDEPGTNAEDDSPSRRFLRACVEQLLSEGVPAAKAKAMARGMRESMLAEVRRSRATRVDVPLLVHPNYYNLECSVTLSNWWLKLMGLDYHAISLPLHVLPSAVPSMSRVYGPAQVRRTTHGTWVAVFAVYPEDASVRTGLVPITLRQAATDRGAPAR